MNYKRKIIRIKCRIYFPFNNTVIMPGHEMWSYYFCDSDRLSSSIEEAYGFFKFFACYMSIDKVALGGYSDQLFIFTDK